MRRVAVIYNPFSGQHLQRRKAVIAETLAVLRGAGIEAELLEIDVPGSAAAHAMDAVRRGFDTVLACGGDGTAHKILQCLVGTEVALGVVPLGTANALAVNLGLGSSPVEAVRRLVHAKPVKVPVGRISYQDASGASGSRYFTVAAGVGIDALFISRLDPALKRRFGYALYVTECMRVWATHSFPLFRVAIVGRSGQAPRVEQVSQLLAVRIRNFGGALHTLAPGATLHKGCLHVIAFKTRSRFRYLRFLLAVIFRRQRFSPHVELLDAVTVDCYSHPDTASRVFVEADGDLLGTLPARIEMADQLLTLLMPANARP